MCYVSCHTNVLYCPECELDGETRMTVLLEGAWTVNGLRPEVADRLKGGVRISQVETAGPNLEKDREVYRYL